jgi:hypothetical protein
MGESPKWTSLQRLVNDDLVAPGLFGGVQNLVDCMQNFAGVCLAFWGLYDSDRKGDRAEQLLTILNLQLPDEHADLPTRFRVRPT